MLSLVFGKKSRTEDLKRYTQESNRICTNKQASVAATASHTAEVSGLNQSLERAKEELGQLKRQLGDKQGMRKSCSRLFRTNFQYDKICFMICARDDDRSRGS